MKNKPLHHASSLPRYFVIGGFLLLVIALLVVKEKTGQPVTTDQTTESAEVQLDHALKAGQPTLAFFHSDNCQQCIVMIGTIAQVYPEFANSITLIDVNVYDESNSSLLTRVGLQYIPTLIFYDRHGNEQVSVGVMEPMQLRQLLVDLVEGG